MQLAKLIGMVDSSEVDKLEAEEATHQVSAWAGRAGGGGGMGCQARPRGAAAGASLEWLCSTGGGMRPSPPEFHLTTQHKWRRVGGWGGVPDPPPPGLQTHPSIPPPLFLK